MMTPSQLGAPVPGNYGWTEMVVTPGAAKFERAARERGELPADVDFISNIELRLYQLI